ncbi:DUF2312 domain-containing protein [Reyranella sp.]|uniref:DUF2312 domain-containing protein n=1 Tax=Reyranella sp. TaxID=1929291 RepID=UPI00403714BF
MSRPVKSGPVSAGRLKSFVERIERLREEKKAIGQDERDVFAEAKGVGYDAPTIRWLLKERELDAADRAERDTLRDVYAHALGEAVHLVLVEGLSLRQAEAATGASKSSIHRALSVPELSREMVADDLGTYQAETFQEVEPQGRAGAPSEPSSPAAEAVNACPPSAAGGGDVSIGQGEYSGTHSEPGVAKSPARAGGTCEDERSRHPPATPSVSSAEAMPAVDDDLTIPHFLRRVKPDGETSKPS